MGWKPQKEAEKITWGILEPLLAKAAFAEYPEFGSNGMPNDKTIQILYLSFNGVSAQEARKQLTAAELLLMHGNPFSFVNNSHTETYYGHLDMHDPELLSYIRSLRPEYSKFFNKPDEEFVLNVNIPMEEYGHPVLAVMPITKEEEKFKELFLEKIGLHITPTQDQMIEYFTDIAIKLEALSDSNEIVAERVRRERIEEVAQKFGIELFFDEGFGVELHGHQGKWHKLLEPYEVVNRLGFTKAFLEEIQRHFMDLHSDEKKPLFRSQMNESADLGNKPNNGRRI